MCVLEEKKHLVDQSTLISRGNRPRFGNLLMTRHPVRTWGAANREHCVIHPTTPVPIRGVHARASLAVLQ